MQKLKWALALALCGGLVACGTNQRPVPVIKVNNDSTVLRVNQPKQTMLPDSIPAGVTAICVDGSYSQATDDSICVGNGGVQTYIARYRSE